MTLRIYWITVLVVVFSAWFPGNVWAGEVECGRLDNGIGPYDYTNPQHRKKMLSVVESYHFNSDVEMLIKGQSSYVWEDLDYTLRAFPNHHRALRSMSMYQLRTVRPADARYYTAECYFDRAIRNAPRDAEVHVLFGTYLHKRSELARALAEFKEAERIKPGTAPDRDYRIGLLLFDMKEYEQALVYAKRAYTKKYPDEVLRENLKKVGKWSD